MSKKLDYWLINRIAKISPHKMLYDQLQARGRTTILSAITFSALLIVVYIFSTERIVMSAIKDGQLTSPMRREEEEVSHEVFHKEPQISLIPPYHVSELERIKWFRRLLPEFKTLESDKLTMESHSRILEFFNKECEVRFFMTWISPAESFGSREFLTLDSLFKVHPRGCLTILSRTLDSTNGYRILKPLLDRNFKVTAVTPDLSFLLKNTPAESWFKELKGGKKDPGEIPLPQNLSNLIRLAVLYKYGGVYLDTDFIVLKSFAGLRNSIGAQSTDTVSKKWSRLNNAVLVFDMNHPLVWKFMEEFASTFNGNKWGHNGPYLVSRVAEKLEGRPGYNFTVLPPLAFYPVNWKRIGGLFKRPENQEGSRWVRAKLLRLSGKTYGVHLWNKQSSRFSIEEGSVMSGLIATHCIICEYKYSS
ncbi:hypothetical protein Tsubulata_030691 [Turnera subulata]|uniref:Alpha 1,4-glycosyltransferase domain-containing protein n=1 Tax=Turnera subulata TaxID=218843 RepID=A0A9Q0FYV4_9ROSI|nr:hypothetical protein Tsubulata_030691 [Turnera subulata]